MSFKMKYNIVSDLLPAGTNRRPGGKIKVHFLVAHDTGNPGSTAKGNINYYRNSPSISASAHIFVDDEGIRECIPAVLGTPERAYHVIYNVTTDNKMYGANANDAAIGVELCWGKGINGTESYKRYVWTLAYLCYKFGLNPKRDIVGHDKLDPKRKIDPTNGLKHIGKTYNQLLEDVEAEYKACSGQSTSASHAASVKEGQTHKIVKGDTLWGIAKNYGTTVAKLKSLNPGVNPDALKIGSTLLITPKPTKSSPTPIQSSNSNVDPRLAEYLRHAPVRPYPGSPVKRGSRGKDVEAIQRAVKVSVDGIFGAKTEAAVKAYQSRFPFLANDGIVGYNTWNVMF
ncbi:N-acetylmuramoyl-L-alanine amidase [Bacillus haynesii]|uniref:N-acetylmuramoyl-L-alanine amidase n=1 Tax=Bacillus haynesii TaxID=1925021 RepID=UPI00227EE931|nr:N-acetylmuramoyl-L-alanine amidase [Bacillus haynesii]MCY8015506.1 N-acetylmuramoyl-L-alanine amidase [Bacillus haynesii]MCY8291505.1 N-acetylmuramoyl-L-alanine amidase [Bacillus haynesii]